MDESHERKYEKRKRRNNYQGIRKNKIRGELFQNRLLYLDIEDGTIEILKLVVSIKYKIIWLAS